MASSTTPLEAAELKPSITTLELTQLVSPDNTKLKIKLETLTSAMCGTIYDYLIYKVQENSACPTYKQQVRAFFKDATTSYTLAPEPNPGEGL